MKIRIPKIKAVLLLFFVILFAGLYFSKPDDSTGAISNFSATMSNSRFSYRGGVDGTPGAGTNTISVDTTVGGSNDNGDIDTDHLFPRDTICFPDAGLNGCSDNQTYTVNSVASPPNGTSFTLTTGLTGALETTDQIIASQEGTITLALTLGTTIPTDGDILVTVPAVDITGETNDGIPDTNATTATNGFDLNSMTTSNVSITTTSGTCPEVNWTVAAVTAGTNSTDHTIRIDRASTTCNSGAVLSIVIGDGTTGLINPAPANGASHTQGTADTYTITVATRNGSDATLETADAKVAPVESVLVSATVDETLSFTLTGVSSGSTRCNATTSVTTYPFAVPFGTLSLDTFKNAAHDISVSTNASGGYAVTTIASNQMGLNGTAACTGDAGEANDCIPDTTCDGGSCTHLAAAVDDWETATNNGFGYSLESSTGSDAAWEYDSSTNGTCDGAGDDFCAAQFADDEDVTQNPVTIMSNSGVSDANAIYVCYRISVSATQPAGYYQNIVRYTATATF